MARQPIPRERPEARLTAVPDDGAAVEHIRLGDWLRAQRLRRGFSYAEIESTTRINRLYLEALEDEHFDAIPAPVYVRGFLRSYARALGLDPEQAIALLPENLPRPPGLEPSVAMRSPYRDAPAISMPSLPSLRLPTIGIGAGRSPGRDAMRWVAAAVGAAALVLAAIFVPPLLRDGASGPPDDGTAAGAVLADGRCCVHDDGDRLSFTVEADGQPVSVALWRNLGGFPAGRPYRSTGVEPMLGRVFDLADAGPDDAARVGASGEVHWRLTVRAACRCP